MEDSESYIDQMSEDELRGALRYIAERNPSMFLLVRSMNDLRRGVRTATESGRAPEEVYESKA
jgi:hypothetical protein